MALMTGLGSLLGGLNNTTAARTGTGSSMYGSSGSTTPTFSPIQSGVQAATGNALENEVANGPNITPLATSGTNSINQTYNSIGDRLQQSLSSRGFGNSGASGTASLETNLGRAGAVGGLQSNLEGYALQQQQTALGQATGFGFAAPGSSYGSSGSTASTYTEPGSVAAGAVGYGQTSLMQQLAMAAANGGFGGLGGTTFTGGPAY